ncbi:DNA replication/repair protein RecF [Hutsoniella sourekii]
MLIKELELKHFRNYDHLQLSFQDGLTILMGENAQGKTNLLEAIFLLSLAKSHRTNHDREMIQADHDRALIKATIEKQDYQFPLELELSSKGKMAKFNYVEQARLSDFIGKLNVILFAPEDLQLVKGSPGTRRRFIDAELGQAKGLYLQNLLEYNRILKQRNTYLKDYGRSQAFDPLYLEILTDQLVERAVYIINQRLDFIQRLNHYAKSIHLDLTQNKEDLVLSYQASHSMLNYQEDEEQVRQNLLELYRNNLEREREKGHTRYGPHRDDLVFMINNKNAQLYGSQGQQRTLVLSLKLAEIDLIYELTGENPILLLDDVLSELDDKRQNILMKRIENRVQTFLTTASLEGIHLDQLDNSRVLVVSNGRVQEYQE